MENSEIQTDGNQNENPKTAGSFLQIFFEPAQCFSGINKKPVFIIPLILCILVTFATSFVIYSKVDMAQVIREQIESSSAAAQMSEEQIAQQVKFGAKFGKISALVAPPITTPLFILLIAGLMMLGIYISGSETTFSRVFSVSTHSMLFYMVISGILTVTVYLIAADPNAINPSNPVFTNPAGLVDFKESKVLYSFLSHLDVLAWYTIYLLGLGLSTVATKCTVAKGIFLVGIWYVLYALIHIGLAAIF